VRRSWKEKRVREIEQQLLKFNVRIMFVKDTVEAAYHAAEKRLISAESVNTIREDAKRDVSG
jgi:hypothetical protein